MSQVSEPIAIVGLGCRYPDADGPDRLWETVLAGRRAFRPIPAARLNLAEYGGPGTDQTYATHAAVLDGWTFDRARFRVPGPAFRASDPAHWLALEVAADTLEAAGVPGGPDRVGVVLGNTMAGEVSRAGQLRLRWPYVRQAAMRAGADAELVGRLEEIYKSPFPEPDDESLAGGLANTIAGRICNHFDLHGGGHTVDAACASSLLAVVHACQTLRAGDLDLVLAGGVDLSLDPFELVGFARTGALAADAMRVYDAEPTGFWPGEGCGLVALMRLSDAMAAGRRIWAVIRGWGVSSDGHGGITRPEAKGQLLALRRAYDRAGFGPETVALFEGHGTGTAVGDQAELQALLAVHRGARPRPAALGTIKANIGHTKAAAGAAGLLKAVLALHHRVLPPTTGNRTPHPLLAQQPATLRLLPAAEPWPDDGPARAAVSAFGFGGINTHVILEEPPRPRARKARPARHEPREAEVFALAGAEVADLVVRLERVAERAATMSFAEHGDLAAALAAVLPGVAAPVRVALVARDPRELAARARHALAALKNDAPVRNGVHLGSGPPAAVGLLFPGQGAALPDPSPGTDTAQPAIVHASLTGLSTLRELGVEAAAAVGHSLGEITALCWAGALSEAEALALATARGRIMAETAAPSTGMMTLVAGPDVVADLIAGTSAVIAADNGPAQVVAGHAADLARVRARAEAARIAVRRLPVAHAFHSPHVAAAAAPLADHLVTLPLKPIERTVISTVTGRELGADDDLRALLVEQVTAPVRFREAVTALAARTGLLVEVGPASGLAACVSALTAIPVVAARDIGETAAALFAAGARTDLAPLFRDRFHRPFDLWRDPSFLENPCERIPVRGGERAGPAPGPEPETGSVAASVRRLVAETLELPLDGIADRDRLLGDLHLNSLRVAQLATRAAAECGREPPEVHLAPADATVGDLIALVETLPYPTPDARPGSPAGVASWHRVFRTERHPITLPPPGDPAEGAHVLLPADPADSEIETLVNAARAAVAARRPLTILDLGDTAAGFAATIRAEHPEVTVRYARLAALTPQARATVRQWLAASGPDDLWLDAAGIPAIPVHRPLPPAAAAAPALDAEDVVLITGGGRGIGLATARAMAGLGVRLALLGRGDPDFDADLAADLARLRGAGATVRYERADVADPEQVRAAVAAVRDELGPITAVVHASGINHPARFSGLEPADYARHAAPKHHGLRNVVDALDPGPLRAVVAYGSVIGRFGLPGEAHYALANGRLRELVRTLAGELPHCWVCTLDWTVWSGTGMGGRLGVLDDLARAGVDPLPPERGVELLLGLLKDRPAETALVVSGRLPALERRPAAPTLTLTPGVEHVTEHRASPAADPLLADHRLDGVSVVPAVRILEMMAATAGALAPDPAEFAQVRFERPVGAEESTLRVCALAGAGGIEVVVRSDETGYAVDHARALLRGGPATARDVPARQAPLPEHDTRDLYGTLFFHGPAYHRLSHYRHLDAHGCTAVLHPDREDGRLGDPARNDATIHVLQACVPHRRLLPVGCERLVVARRQAQGRLTVAARERAQEGPILTYDVAVTDEAGHHILDWVGLTLRDVGPLPHPGGLPPLLAGPYLHRQVAGLLPGADLRITVEPAAADRTAARTPAGRGRSRLPGLALVADGPGVTCDWEAVTQAVPVPTAWHGHLRELIRMTGEPEDTVRTRLWTVQECLVKAGRARPGPLTVRAVYEDGWLTLAAGHDRVVSGVFELAKTPVAVAVLAEGTPK